MTLRKEYPQHWITKYDRQLYRKMTTDEQIAAQQVLKQRNELIWALTEGSSTMARFMRVNAFYKHELIITMIRLFIICDANGYALAYSSDEPFQVSYARKPEYRLVPAKRTRTTITRFIRRRYGVTSDIISDADMDKIFRHIYSGRTVVNSNQNIKIVRGKDLINAYESGFGCDSCMTGDRDDLLELYRDNPDKVGLALYTGNARALVWTCDDGTTVVDRIYPNDGKHCTVFEDWAHSNGYIYRNDNYARHGKEVPLLRMNEDPTDARLKQIAQVKGVFYVTCKMPKHNMPFLDTFLYAMPDEYNNTVVLSNAYHPDRPCFYCEYTEGGLPWLFEDRFRCTNCGCHVHEDHCEWYNDDAFCSQCWDELFSYCEVCECIEYKDCMIYIEDYGLVCAECYNTHVRTCCICEQKYIINTHCKYEGEVPESVRDASAIDCSVGPDHEPNICDECILAHYTKCYDCLTWYPLDSPEGRRLAHEAKRPCCIKCLTKEYIADRWPSNNRQVLRPEATTNSGYIYQITGDFIDAVWFPPVTSLQ